MLLKIACRNLNTQISMAIRKPLNRQEHISDTWIIILDAFTFWIWVIKDHWKEWCKLSCLCGWWHSPNGHPNTYAYVKNTQRHPALLDRYCASIVIVWIYCLAIRTRENGCKRKILKMFYTMECDQQRVIVGSWKDVGVVVFFCYKIKFAGSLFDIIKNYLFQTYQGTPMGTLITEKHFSVVNI